MRYSFIVNPVAGGGNAKKAWTHLENYLKQAQVDYDVKITHYAGHAEYLAQKMTENEDSGQRVVIAVGGDGTLNEVLNGLAKVGNPANLPLADIPCGSGKDFARSYGISTDPIKAFQQIQTAKHPNNIFVGHYQEAIKNTEWYFVNNVGIGFDAAIVSRANHSNVKKRLNHAHMGTFSYLSQALRVLYDQQPFSLSVEDSRHHDVLSRAFLCIANNGAYIGGGFQVDPSASIHNSDISLVVAERKKWLQTLYLMWQLVRGKLPQSRFAHYYHGKRIHYSTNSLEFMQIDGNDGGNRFADLTIDCQPFPFWQTPLNNG